MHSFQNVALEWAHDNQKDVHYYRVGPLHGHLEECKTFLDRKNVSPPAASAHQEPQWGEHRWVNPDGDEQMGEINMIFGGSMSIFSKTQGNKLERAQLGSAH
jgi:hypothetical protein